MKRLSISLFACFLFLLFLLILSPDAFAKKKPPCKPTLTKCPAQGCGTRFDALLNRAKNRVSPPATASIVDMTLAEIKGMEQPDTWTANKNRAELKTGGMREGQAVRVMAYLWAAKREGAESCNCGLDASGKAGEILTDIHMVLNENADDPEAISVTAEIKPSARAARDGRTFPEILRPGALQSNSGGSLATPAAYLTIKEWES